MTAPLAGPDLIRAEVRRLPNRPGVYRMLGEIVRKRSGDEREVLYVGKAKDLKKRVASYTKLGGHSNRIMAMIAATRAMEFITTETETESLLLEANLIKRLKPKYNTLLRDDKSFPHILIALDHEAPQIRKHRGAQSRKGHYFGPFASAGAVDRTLNTLQKAFLLRSCKDSVYDSRTRPCLLYEIKRCAAPCVDYVSTDEYRELVDEAEAFLRGKSTAVMEQLSKDMERAAENLQFEKAAALRDRIRALSAVRETQIINPGVVENADVFAIHAEGGQSCVQVFFFRAGQNWGNHAYFPRHEKDAEPADVLDAFLAQFYDGRDPAPSILLSDAVPNADLLAEALGVRQGRKIEVRVPERGEKRTLVEHARTNAKEALGRKLSESASQEKLLAAVAETFDLDAPPRRIEVYDNSHVSGTNAVGGMVVAGPEGFQKAQYRTFNIKSEELSAGDDFGMMREVLARRFARLMKEDHPGSETWPDLVVVDGGQGQLSAAREVMEEMGLEGVTLLGVSKGRRETEAGAKRVDRTMGATGEQFHLIDKPPFTLEARSPVLYYLQRLRDEAHRYAIGQHRARRKKQMTANPLDGIEGVGPARKKALLHRFGSAKGVARASVADLTGVDGVSEPLAHRIYDYFHSRQS
ncbi:MAG: excinuclease ABC subunit UvrC [Pseudomonadota bacterium]